MATLRALPGYIVLQPIEEDYQSPSGLVVPQKDKDKPAKGKVINVGKSTHVSGILIECPVSVGDTVYYRRWAGEDIQFEGKSYHFSRFDELVGIIDG